MIGIERTAAAGMVSGRPCIRNLRWYIILLFFFATIISYVDRQALSVNAPHLRRDLGLSATQYSYLVTAFLVAYTMGPVLAGRLIDSIGIRLGMTCAIVWWSVAASLHAFGSSLAALLALRFCLGLGEAATLPSTIKAVFEWFPVRDRAMATSIFSSGTAIGAVVAVPIVAFTTAWLGWRTSFLVTGLLGFLWLIPWLLLYGRPEDHPRLSPDERSRILAERLPSSARPRSPLEVLRHRKPWGVILGRFMVDPVWQFYLFWLPSYLVQQRGFSLRDVGLFGWIPFLATDIGSLTGGWLSGRLLTRTGSLTHARRVVLAVGAIGTLAGLPAAWVSQAWLCVVFVCCAAFAIGLWAPTALTLCADIMPRGAVGTMTGLSSVGAGLGGIILTPVIGWLVDHYSYVPVFVLAALLPQVGYLLLTTITGTIEPVVFDEPCAGISLYEPMTGMPLTSTLEGAWRTARFNAKDGGTDIDGVLLLVDGHWSTLYFVGGQDAPWASSEAGTYESDGGTLTFLHRLTFQGGGGRPLRVTQSDSDVEACPITLTGDSLTIQFPSGNTLVCYRLHRG